MNSPIFVEKAMLNLSGIYGGKYEIGSLQLPRSNAPTFLEHSFWEERAMIFLSL